MQRGLRLPFRMMSKHMVSRMLWGILAFTMIVLVIIGITNSNLLVMITGKIVVAMVIVGILVSIAKMLFSQSNKQKERV